MSDLVVVAQFNNVHEASAALAILEAEGIPCFLKDEFNSSYMKPFDFVGSAVKIVVSEKDSALALELLIDAEILKREDLGLDPAFSRLSETLESQASKKIFRAGSKAVYWLIAVFLMLVIFIVLLGSGGGKF